LILYGSFRTLLAIILMTSGTARDVLAAAVHPDIWDVLAQAPPGDLWLFG
jgi:hypothetical protein